MRRGEPGLLRMCKWCTCIPIASVGPRVPLSPAWLRSLLSWFILKWQLIPIGKLATGLTRKGFICQLFNSFFSLCGTCFFVKITMQATSLEDLLSFLWVIFWFAFRWQRGGAEELMSAVIFMPWKPFWMMGISGNLYICTVPLVMMPQDQK